MAGELAGYKSEDAVAPVASKVADMEAAAPVKVPARGAAAEHGALRGSSKVRKSVCRSIALSIFAMAPLVALPSVMLTVDLSFPFTLLVPLFCSLFGACFYLLMIREAFVLDRNDKLRTPYFFMHGASGSNSAKDQLDKMRATAPQLRMTIKCSDSRDMNGRGTLHEVVTHIETQYKTFKTWEDRSTMPPLQTVESNKAGAILFIELSVIPADDASRANLDAQETDFKNAHQTCRGFANFTYEVVSPAFRPVLFVLDQDRRPWWFSTPVYLVATMLFLGPLYRVAFFRKFLVEEWQLLQAVSTNDSA